GLARIVAGQRQQLAYSLRYSFHQQPLSNTERHAQQPRQARDRSDWTSWRTTPRKLPEKWSRPKRHGARSRRRVSRETCGQVGRILDRPGYSSGCEARNLNPSNAGAAHGSPSSRSGRLRCGRRNDEGGRRLAGQPVVYVALREGRAKRLSDVLRNAAQYV